MTAPIAGSAARVDSAGKVKQLGPKASADEVVTELDVQQPSKLARLLCRILAQLAALRRQWAPRRLDFEDVVLAGAAGAGVGVRLQHNFGGRVRWWVVEWTFGGGGAASGPVLLKGVAAGEITDSTIVLYSYQAGTATIRVEEAG